MKKEKLIKGGQLLVGSFALLFFISIVIFARQMKANIGLLDVIRHVKHTHNITSITTEIRHECKEELGKFYVYERKPCVVNKVREFVNAINYTDDTYFESSFSLNNNPEDTLQNGGDCENHAILAVTLLKNLNVDTYLVYQDDPKDFNTGHLCVLAKVDDYEFQQIYCVRGSDWEFVGLKKV